MVCGCYGGDSLSKFPSYTGRFKGRHVCSRDSLPSTSIEVEESIFRIVRNSKIDLIKGVKS